MPTELEQAQKRIAELATMLNNAHRTAQLQVEDERDACERALQALLESAEAQCAFTKVGETERGTMLKVEPNPSKERIEALQQALETVRARKNPAVQMVAEMAHGTMIGEYVEACVYEAQTAWQASLNPLLDAAAAVAGQPGNETLKIALEKYNQDQKG